LPWEGAVRTRMVLLVLLLLAGTMLGVHKDIPVL
jgi:hypothetical protein